MDRLRRFLIGRNGSDQLAKTVSILACILLILSMIFSGVAGSILWMLALMCLVYAYFRIFSRNIPRRQAENEKFLSMVAPLTKQIRYLKLKTKQRNIYSFFKCPNCGTVLRVPKNKGHVRITCKNCSKVFERNT